MKRAILMFLLVSLSAAYAPPSFAADQPAIATVLSVPAKADIGTKTQCAVCGMKLRVKPISQGLNIRARTITSAMLPSATRSCRAR